MQHRPRSVGAKRGLALYFYEHRSATLGMRDLTLPAVCDVSVTSVGNAACDFCGFARNKTLAGAARYLDAEEFSRALLILHRGGIQYITLQGENP
jgi:2-iminoacetate synthase ThiH